MVVGSGVGLVVAVGVIVSAVIGVSVVDEVLDRFPVIELAQSDSNRFETSLASGGDAAMTNHYLVGVLGSVRACPAIAIVLDGPHGREGKQMAAFASEFHESFVSGVVGLAHAVGRIIDCSDGDLFDRVL